ncbi:hypothetical protein FLA_4757 [Filimonas lacunae]|nr:hypothetical protein FLA_4757 [Filimonas lacunae]
MILFGLALCASFFFFRQIWLIVLGIAWIAIPILLTVDDEEHFD